MTRVAFKMKLKSSKIDEYKKRHNEIWPELKNAISNAGISNYSIFYDEETGILFAYHEMSSSSSADKLCELEIVQKWLAYMSDLTESNPDQSPICTSLFESFHLD